MNKILTLLNIPPLIELSLGQSLGFTVLKKLSLSRSICSRMFPKGSSIFGFVQPGRLSVSKNNLWSVRPRSRQTSLEPSRNRPRSWLLGLWQSDSSSYWLISQLSRLLLDVRWLTLTQGTLWRHIVACERCARKYQNVWDKIYFNFQF